MKSVIVPVLAAAVAIPAVILGAASMYVVDEGRVAVITNMGRAVRQETPSGLQFKTPIIEGVREFDVRERALSGTLDAATKNQLVTTVEFSINWNPDPEQIMPIFVKYGSPEEFASNTLKPRLQQSLKATIGKFTGADLTRERETVAAAMLDEARRVLESYPAIISSVQIENFSLPQRYMEAVLQKEEQREATERESLRLQQQEIASRQEVQTAAAERDATKARADGEAYSTRVAAEAEADAIRLLAQAEAEGIEAVQKAIASDPMYIEYQRISKWTGTLPTTVLGESPALIMDMGK